MTDLNKNFLVKSAMATLSGKNEINERLDNLLLSVKGTHLFNRGLGFINRVLFRDLSNDSADSLITIIISIIDEAIPEILVDRSRSQAIPFPEEGYYLIQIYYSLSSTSTQGNYQNKLEITNG